jgi:DNA-binding HxlR family transcriptional regulator
VLLLSDIIEGVYVVSGRWQFSTAGADPSDVGDCDGLDIHTVWPARSAVMTAPRSYGQNCSLARAMDLVGERWTVLIVRELARGPKRFGDLGESLTGIGTTMLAARLKRLQAADVIERAESAPGIAGYQLTARGERLARSLGELMMWGLELPGVYQPDDESRAAWTAMTMQSALDRAERAAPEGTYAFNVGEEHFWLRVPAQGPSVLRDGTPPYPADATLTITATDFSALATGTPLSDLDAVTGGDHDRLVELLELFHVPSDAFDPATRQDSTRA